MKVHTLPYIIYRSYPDFGYLTDNRNFGYDTASGSCLKVGELMLSKVASIFYSVLSPTPQDIDTIVQRLCQYFPGVLISTISCDATKFYKNLHQKGFVFAGDDSVTPSLSYFSYDNRQPYSLNLTQKQADDTTYSDTFGRICQLTRVHIDIASRCNENCVHCYIPSTNKRSIMPKEVFEEVLSQCKEMNVINLTISGGEPMLNPFLARFLQQCKQGNFSVNVLSNLTLLSDELIDVFADNSLLSVQTSLYAMNEEVHDTITRNKGSFSKTLNSIKRLHERNIPMQINCPVMKQNKLHFKEVLRFAESMNIEADFDYSLFGCYDSSKSNLSCRLSVEEIEKTFFSDTEVLARQKESSYKKKDSDSPICPVCKTSLCISNSGDVYPCEGWQSLILGNIRNHQLRKIWEESPQISRLRDLSFEHFPQCNTCEDKDYCSPCLIMNANEDAAGDFSNINPFVCNVARIKKMNIQNC